MRVILPLLAATAVAISMPAAAQEATGDWFGVLEPAPGTRLLLVVHIKVDDAGVLTIRANDATKHYGPAGWWAIEVRPAIVDSEE